MNKVTRQILLLLVLLSPAFMFAQKYSQENDDYDAGKKPYKLGIQTGLTVGGLNSTGIRNDKPSIGMHGGLYFRKQISKTFHFESGIAGSISGARFENGDSGYSRFSTLYLELPQILMISLDKKFDHSVLLGVQPSYILRSSLYVGFDPQATYADYYDLPLNKVNVFAVGGYHFNTDMVGFRVLIKYGMLNMNKSLSTYNSESVAHPGRWFNQMDPPFNFSDPLKSWMVDVSLFF